MRIKELLLLSLFVASIVSLGVILDVTITGKVSQSMYCDKSGNCYELCSYMNKCSQGLECCDVQGLGVCGESCDQVYEQMLPASVDVDARGAELQAPSAINFVSTVVYLSLILVAILVAVIYFGGRKHGKN